MIIHLRYTVVDSGQKFCQMLGVVVAEDMLGNSAVADALDHGGVVARVGENFAAWENILQIKTDNSLQLWKSLQIHLMLNKHKGQSL